MTALPSPAVPFRPRRRAAACAALALTLATGACTSSVANDDDDPGGGTTSAAVPPGVTPPETTDGEISRSVHAAEGADGVPETADTVSQTLDAGSFFRVEGACTGTRARMPFTVATAAAGEEQELLLEGSIACGVGLESDGFVYRPAYDGPVQTSIAVTDGVDSGWVRLVSTEG